MMKVTKHKQNTKEWEKARLGKVTSTKLKDITPKRGGGNRKGFYKLLAEILATPSDVSESALKRGQRLEGEAINAFEEEHDKEVDRDLFVVSEDNDRMAVSPDGLIENNEEYTEAIEVKCLSSANHLKGIIEDEVPKKYEYQILQYFIVIDELEKLYFTFYDPRIEAKPMHVIEKSRDELQEKIEDVKELQRNRIKEIEQIINDLTF